MQDHQRRDSCLRLHDYDRGRIYVMPDLRPATYRLTIEKEGFRTVVQPSLQLYVQDAVNENFTLAVGPA
jgi:hypothetical protein